MMPPSKSALTRSLLALALLAGACVRVRPAEAPTAMPEATAPATPSPTLTATAEPAPTATVEPSPTPAPTDTPAATATPEPEGRVLPDWAAGAGASLYFLRAGDLWRLDVKTGEEARVVEGVADFAVSGEGRVAYVQEGKLWITRNGQEPIRLGEGLAGVPALPTWSSRGLVAWTQSAHAYGPDWVGWGRWCAEGTVHVWAGAEGEIDIGPGCQPAWSPEGLRLAFATTPTFQEEYPPAAGNAIHLVNNRGENEWAPVEVGEDVPEQLPQHAQGFVVYAPVWAPDGQSFHFFRFLGMAIETDFSSLERSSASQGGAELKWVSGAWGEHAGASGSRVAYAMGGPNAAGFEGYLAWRVEVVDVTRETALTEYIPILDNFPPEENPITLGGSLTLKLDKATSPALSPDGTLLAYLGPAEGQAEGPEDDYAGPGELWLRQLGSENAVRLTGEVDFRSPLVWR